ncbi:MAG: monooxygenase, partial [Microbacteriaceae bacterium]|nr:monooxygenase [Microbacteriaceae bacterium]
KESDLQVGLVQRLLDASSSDTIVTRSYSGKPARMLRTPWVEEWEGDGHPAALPTPLQGLLVRDAMTSAVEHGIEPVLGTPVGQVVGELTQRESCAAIINRLVEQYIEAEDRMIALSQSSD